jgi:hypothetical protein
MSGAVYLLCGATCLLCAVLLLRGYAKTKVRLLLWSGLCFVALGVENTLLYADLIVFPHFDLSLSRRLAALVGMLMLLFGLVWDSK